MKEEQADHPLQTLFLQEAAQLLNRAEEAGPDNANHSYAVHAFFRLAEAVLRYSHPDERPTCDLGAIAQTAETYLANNYQPSLQMHMAHLMTACLQRAIEEEGRKVDLPFWDYSAIPDPHEGELENYGSGYDPLMFHKFTQRVLTKGVLRVRVDNNEILRAILDLNESAFPETSTREEFIDGLADVPAEIRDRLIADLDLALSAQLEQKPEVVAHILRELRRRMIDDYTNATFRGFVFLVDPAIRCAIAATVFAASKYSNATNAETSGKSEEEIAKALPLLTDLKKHVAAYFADWFVKLLPTRPPEGKKAIADRVRTDLWLMYQSVIEDWCEASQNYKTALASRSEARRDSWRSDIKRDFHHLPEDLIERLVPKHLWPTEINQRISDKGGGSNPKDIALEHAARLCDADDYSYKLSSLREYLKQQKRSEKTK